MPFKATILDEITKSMSVNREEKKSETKFSCSPEVKIFSTGNIHTPTGLNAAKTSMSLKKKSARLFYIKEERDFTTKHILRTWVECWIKKKLQKNILGANEEI